MQQQLCICAHVPTLMTHSKLLLLIDEREACKPTNTGRLAARCLSGSTVMPVGDRRELKLPAAGKMVWLFPSEDAVLLDVSMGPLTLVVPDGTWRQARKLHHRFGRDHPCVVLPVGTQTNYRLRAEQRPGGLATMEAIAAAFRILEGDESADAMLEVFNMMVDRTLWLRGQLRDHEVSGGIPIAAQQHDPRGGLPPSNRT
jgi:DTW domain-containing protein